MLGVLLHAAISFMEPEFPFWPAIDSSRSLVFAVFIVTVHAFRMQTFFFMAGFFAGLVVQKRGYIGFAKHRCQRIVLPLVLAAFTLIPVVQVVWVTGYNRQDEMGPTEIAGETIDLSAYQSPLGDFFQSGGFIHHFNFFHLWFLWYLLTLYLIFLVVARAYEVSPVGQLVDKFTRWVCRTPWKPLVLTLPTFVFMLPMKTWSADGPFHILPEWRIVLYYGFFFACGWLLYRQRDLLPELKKTWWTCLLTAALLLPAMLFLLSRGPLSPETHDPSVHLPAIATYSLFTWLMICGLTGMFICYFDRPSRAMRYISDSSYWVYLAHLPLVIAMQIVAVDVAAPWLVKFPVIMVLATVLLFASYEWLVRYTFIGTILNGRKRRAKGEASSYSNGGASEPDSSQP